ncbi:triphosphoribosyl-dephospho-CoA synthase MdcB [Massilia atriviolacea]|uniref:Probable 2-(5''-triphosphoribosyl)-3'-dephosphocoenzyme-A synthase n=1 Tax=Massilia atriviolacea TaxID=2495579 RepID=A0A430HUH7_9BURK|nr:triphosphoribosyl-dephospho-CoA synthase MdcB [Massilia atriviolacea]RSZ61024.1 triphosphoribosyl-dephospho-CoA synthase MdcB [Massilia atriviolacea]
MDAQSFAPRVATSRTFSRRAARLAIASLYAELALYPKPGLVSLIDNGSHTDMDALTFMRSLFSLRHYFRRICMAGSEGAPFHALKRLGIDAEARMLRATGGVNTHRGAIFSLGLLCAAAGRAAARGDALTAPALQAHLLAGWGKALADHTAAPGMRSHGLAAGALHGASGARQEAARGLPSVFGTGLGALRRTLKAGRDMRHARIDALFALMVHVSDTNVLHRGGPQGAAFVRIQASAFCHAGGTASQGWEAHALAIHHGFVERKLSPGGAADLLAASCFVHALTVEHER